MQLPFTSADWSAIAPLGVLAATGLTVLIVDLLARDYASRVLCVGIGVLGAIVAGILAARQYGHDYDAFFGGFLTGGFTTVFTEIILIALIGSLLLYATLGNPRQVAGITALMLWSTCGAVLMAGSANLMTIFLGLELLSLGLYALCGLSGRRSSRESALKYLLLSSTASGFLLYGMALLFAATGSVMLADFTHPAVAGNALLWIGSGMFFVGLAFKLSLVPFHAWTPDVYEGAPLPVTAYMTVATKAAAIAVLARWIYAALPSGTGDWLLIPIWVVAGVSMIAGNAGMLAQTDLKRLIAYSGIAQMGYVLTALAGATPLGLRYAIYYLTAYTFMNLGAFAVAAALSDDAEQGSRLANYQALGRRRPWLAAAMTVFLLALAGLPPTAGFLGKILILASSVDAGFVVLAALLIVGTAISLYAYAKVVRAMYASGKHHKTHDVRPLAPLAWVSAAICAVAVIAMTFYPITPSNVLPLVK
jgi:NADH-quinone oxidoreductase subunit N